jgi:hypothetical protein
MQKSYESGSATHIGPESCGAVRKSSIEALTGERAGRVFSRESELLRDAADFRNSAACINGPTPGGDLSLFQTSLWGSGFMASLRSMSA